MDKEYSAVHHYIWDIAQQICLIPVFLLVSYRFFFGIWDLSKYYIPETLGTHWEILRFYNLRNLPIDIQEEKKRREKYEKLPRIENSFIDYLFFLYISTGMPYYYCDIAYKLFYVGFFNLDTCQWSYIIHHFLTIYFYKFYGSVYYYTWYLMAPSAYHSIIISFPKFYWNFHVYGLCLAAFTLSQIFIENMRSTRNHKHLILSVPLLTPCLLVIAALKCQE